MMDRVMGGARAGTAIIGAMTGVRVAQMRYAQDNGAGLIGSGSGEVPSLQRSKSTALTVAARGSSENQLRHRSCMQLR